MTCRTQRPASLHSCLVFAHVFDTFHHEKSPVCVWTCGGTSAAPRDAEARPTQRRGRGSRLPRACPRAAAPRASSRRGGCRSRRRGARPAPPRGLARPRGACVPVAAGGTHRMYVFKRLSCTRVRAAADTPDRAHRGRGCARHAPRPGGPPWGPHVASRSSYKTVVHTYSISYQG